jgi:hypothetical protein
MAAGYMLLRCRILALQSRHDDTEADASGSPRSAAIEIFAAGKELLVEVGET